MLKVTIFPERLIGATSQVFAGLYDLRHNKELRVRRASADFPALDPESLHEWLIALRVQDEDGSEINAVIDLIDGQDIASVPHLEWADIYFKSSLRVGTPAYASQKVVPYGLRYAITSSHESLLDRFRFALSAGFRGRGSPHTPSTWMLRTLSQPTWLAMSRFKSTEALSKLPPTERYFESSPSSAVTPRVYYRTKTYSLDAARTPEDAEEFHKVNEMRANTIRALRSNLGRSFVGGIRPTPFALANYSDVVMREPWSLRKHLEMVKSSAICVTTHGLFGATDWKVAEYLAASKCIVLEKLLDQLPVPLKEGRQALSFTSPEECVQQCERILREPGLLTRLRQGAWTYYQQHVRPSSIVRNCLETALGRKQASNAISSG